jgi:RNA polymerase sigma-70 factor (ECF subfamily)
VDVQPRIDEELARRASDGDLAALAHVLDRYRPSLYAAAIQLLRNREDARDAVQETSVIALARIGSLRDPAAVGSWLHRVLRNVCLMQLRSASRVSTDVELAVAEAPSMEEALEHAVLRDWVWAAIDELSAEERATTILRHFSRTSSYEGIAAVTDVPVGTVRSRLNRARSLLAAKLQREARESFSSRERLESARRSEWEGFYAELHEKPTRRTYRSTYAADVMVSDRNGRWRGVREWSDHEREAIALGVRARILDLVAARDITVIEIDFTNPDRAAGHCPPRSTFVHRLTDGRSRRLDIHYV